MAVHHIYAVDQRGTEKTLFPISQWGSCWAALQFQNCTTRGDIQPNTEGKTELHVFWKGRENLDRILELLMQSDYWKRLTDCDMEVVDDLRTANDKPWVDQWGTMVGTAHMHHFKLNGQANAPGIVTGFRMLVAYSNLTDHQLEAIVTPDDAALALLYSVAIYGNNFFSDGSPGMYSPTGEDYHTYVEEFGKIDREELYYEKLVSWAGIRQGTEYYDTYNVSDHMHSIDKGDLASSATYITESQVVEVFSRTHEQMRALERGHGPLIPTGYLKDFEFLNNEDGGDEEIPNDPNFSFTINGAIRVPIDFTGKRLPAFSPDTLAGLKAAANIQ